MRRIIAVTTFVLFLCICRYSYGQQIEKIQINLGENVVITLDANHTTGFSWQLAKPLDKNKLRFIKMEYVTGGTKLIGGGGEEVWTFQTLNKGQTEIDLKYVRPWEKDTPAAKETKFVVIIQ